MNQPALRSDLRASFSAGGRLSRVAVVVGTRPEVIKVAKIVELLGSQALVFHSGQHYDSIMSESIMDHFGFPMPLRPNIQIGGLPRGQQIGRATQWLNAAFDAASPAAVVVQGDTNTASAGAQAASYSGIPLVHVEAGLRSFDSAMPEEVNRRVIGALADLHCAPTTTSRENLLREGISESAIRVTGNTVVEATEWSLAQSSAIPDGVVPDHSDGYVLATIHRPENTDSAGRLTAILEAMERLPLPVLLSTHPRLRAAIDTYRLAECLSNVRLIAPLEYGVFLRLAAQCRMLISDSGGLQEESTVLKKPVLVLRRSTERPEAVAAGFSRLVTAPRDLPREVSLVLSRDPAALADTPSPYGDGSASASIYQSIQELIANGTGPLGTRYQLPPQ